MKPCSWEYVASGLSHVGTFATGVAPVAVDFFNETLTKLNGSHDHYISLLYNAYQEKKLGTFMYDNLTTVNNMYADSGGLQMVSLGKEITRERKAEIYRLQAKKSTIAMIFDEIPAVSSHNFMIATTKNVAGVKSKKSELKDVSSRKFDKSKFEWCAKATAQNIVDQIKVFKEEQSSAKIICILQGNTVADYQAWFDIILKEVPKELHESIGGIAFGSPAFGDGMLEDIERFFFMSQLHGPEHLLKHFHLLGIGSVKRLLPLTVFKRTGLIPKDVLTSYDSTKHTGGLSRGDMQVEEKCLRAYRDTQVNMAAQMAAIETFCKEYDIEPMDELLIRHTILQPKNFLNSKYGHIDNFQNVTNKAKFLILLTSIYNVIKTIERCSSDEAYFNSICHNPAIIQLKTIKTQADYDHWFKHCSGSVPSNRVEVLTDNLLMGMFD